VEELIHRSETLILSLSKDEAAALSAGDEESF
jgi:hypothetical protein